MSATTTDVALRAYHDGDRDEVLDLLTRSLAGGPTGERTERFFRWKHEENPFGRSHALVAVADGRVVGFRTFLRWRFRLGDRRVAAVRAVDTATHPDHRGRGLFTRLTLAALEDLRATDDLVFNTPNNQSLPGYLKMGWRTVGVVPIAIRPVRPARFLRGLRAVERGGPAGTVPDCPLPPVAEVLADGPAVAALVRDTGGVPDRLVTDRSVAYLRWRYAQAPDLDYRAIPLWDGPDLWGLAIGRPRRRGPLAELTLSEVLVRDGDGDAARRLLRAAARSGVDHVAAHLAPATPVARAGRRAGYLRPPGRGMTLVANPLRDLPVDAVRPAAWQLSLGDLEVF